MSGTTMQQLTFTQPSSTQVTTPNGMTYQWLKENSVMVPFGDKEEPAVSGRKLWKKLKSDNKDQRGWWNKVRKRLKLVDGKDFVCLAEFGQAKKGRGGRNQKEEFLLLRTAIQVAATDVSDVGLTVIQSLAFLVDEVEKGNVELCAYAISKLKDPEDLVEIANVGIRNAVRHKIEGGMSPEDALAWVNARFKGVGKRLGFTSTLKYADVKEPIDYARITNAVYRGGWDDDAAGLRIRYGITNKKETPRNFMEIEDISRLDCTEDCLSKEIQTGNVKGADRIARLCEARARLIRDACEKPIVL